MRPSELPPRQIVRETCHTRLSLIAPLVAVLVSSFACQGRIGAPLSSAPPTTNGGTGSGAGPGQTGSGASSGQTGSGGSAGSEPIARLEKLTASQFANSLRDLLGPAAPLGPVEPDNVVDGFATVGASTLSASASGVGQYEAVTGAATQYAFADATHAAAVLSCVPTSTSDAACMTQGLKAFGRRAFRRPLSSDETGRFVALATSIGNKPGSSVLVGLRHAVWAMLQSPSFLYRVELGVPTPLTAADSNTRASRSPRVWHRRSGTRFPTTHCWTPRQAMRFRRPTA